MLQKLVIENALITDEGLKGMISGSSHNLKEFCLINCQNITDKGLNEIKECISLISLQLQG